MRTTAIFSIFAFLLLTFSACDVERVGPYEEDTRTYGLTNFDRISMGSALNVTVQAGSAFAIEVVGNRRDLDDLEVYSRNGTLHAEYRGIWRNRRYGTRMTITMPTLRGVDFSGAVRSTISGFQNLRELDVTLSGASKASFNSDVARINLDLSGASDLDLKGSGNVVRGKLSGASTIYAFDFTTSDVELDLSGASSGRVRVAQRLDITASGASSVRYRGTPEIRSRLSGSSTIRQD